MNLSAPKKTTLWVSLLLAVLAVLGKIYTVPLLSEYAFTVLAVAFVILLLGCILKNF